MKVKVKRLHPDAQLPVKKYENDFCYDVYAVSEEEIAPNIWRYGLGLAFQMCPDPVDYCGGLVFSIDLRPRSSVWKTGMVLSNCEGTVDEQYRGEVSAVFYHVMPNMPRYRIGDRIGQLKIGFTEQMDFEIVEELDCSDRGTNGYGSTGR